MKRILLGASLISSIALADHGSFTMTKDAYVELDATQDHADLRVPYPGIHGVCGVRVIIDVNELFPVLPMQEIADSLKGTWYEEEVKPRTAGNTILFNVPESQLRMFVTTLHLTTRDGASLGGAIENKMEGYTLKALHASSIDCPKQAH